MPYDPAYWARKEKDSLKQRKNSLQESMPKLLSLCKRLPIGKARSMGLRLYFSHKRELSEILVKLSELAD